MDGGSELTSTDNTVVRVSASSTGLAVARVARIIILGSWNLIDVSIGFNFQLCNHTMLGIGDRGFSTTIKSERIGIRVVGEEPTSVVETAVEARLRIDSMTAVDISGASFVGHSCCMVGSSNLSVFDGTTFQISGEGTFKLSSQLSVKAKDVRIDGRLECQHTTLEASDVCELTGSVDAAELVLQAGREALLQNARLHASSANITSDRVAMQGVTTIPRLNFFDERAPERPVELFLNATSLTVTDVNVLYSNLTVAANTYSIVGSNTFRAGDFSSQVRLANREASNLGSSTVSCSSCRNRFLGPVHQAIMIDGPNVTLQRTDVTGALEGIWLMPTAVGARMGSCNVSNTIALTNTTVGIRIDADDVHNYGVNITSATGAQSIGISIGNQTDGFANLPTNAESGCNGRNNIAATVPIHVPARPRAPGDPFATSHPAPAQESPSTQGQQLLGPIIAAVFIAIFVIIVVVFVVRRQSHGRSIVMPMDDMHSEAIKRLKAQFELLPVERSNSKSLRPSAISSPIRQLGQGAYGDVHACTVTVITSKGASSQLVAVKTLKPTNVVDLAAADYVDDKLVQFYLESEVMLRLNHPHIVQAVGLQHVEQPVQLCLEFCDGGDVLEWLRDRSELPEDLVDMHTDMAGQVAAGVKYLHGHNIIHRDLAARNVLLDSTNGSRYRCGWQLKLADLGLARGLQSTETYYKQKSDAAVPFRWQDPFAMADRKYTKPSDVFSFGVVIWEIYSNGEVPYAELSAMEVVAAVAVGRRLPPASPATPRVVNELMLACMDHRPEQRPTMTVVARRLLELAQEQDTETEL
eukprot:TRINITY_DN10728_c0_g3_i3.p1 TRINITY_DN10728_c0_g3~~TRINITY_DN10728_c0_g3_i3.p1  ORF type:complete len:920 (+),score=112.24 TRINITY_DN10728_c0_g3_i3:333-2762(+)